MTVVDTNALMDRARRIIYVDYSILTTLQSCPEKVRLNYVEGYRPNRTEEALSFGHAYHAFQEAYYDALAGGFRDVDHQWHRFPEPMDPVKVGKAAFLRDLQAEGAEMQVTIDEGKRARSIERGLALCEAYTFRWKSELYDNILDPNGRPYVEIPFQVPLMLYRDWRIVYFGRIDRIMRSRMTLRPVNFELKSTTQALSMFMKAKKPNHQVTGYYYGAWQLVPEVRETIWDATFVSDRQPNVKKATENAKGARFWMWGIDTEKDFARETTTRSQQDVDEWLDDAKYWARQYVDLLLDRPSERWPRTAPTACHAYGGCKYRGRVNQPGVCEHRADVNILNAYFTKVKYDPLKKDTHESTGDSDEGN